MPRLHPDRLNQLPAAVQRPQYDRAALRWGIVHMGIGAFMRAHLAVATEAALAAGDLRWGIVGVSLRQADTRDALEPQGGLYTVAVRDADAQGQPRQTLQVLGAVGRVLVAPESPTAVLAQIAAPDTRIVSLTITEKGYCHDPASGRLRLDHPDIAHDLQHPQAPRTAIGFMVWALQQRFANGLPGLTLMSLDNLPANGQVLQGAVLDFARRIDSTLAERIACECRFPCSMVDRIVPRTSDADRALVSAALGCDDQWPVMAEPFFDWAVEDQFANGHPDWGYARIVHEAAPWERLKLRMVNGTHSCIAYLGAMAGWNTVDVAMRQPALTQFLQTLMQHEIEPTLPALPGLDLAAYRSSLLERFANPALAHRTQQIAMDGSQKLPQRWLGTVRDRLATQHSIDHLALGLAAWVHYLRGVNESGEAYTVDDPHAAALQALYRETVGQHTHVESVQRMLAYAPVFGDLAGNTTVAQAVLPHLQRLQTLGVQASLLA
ncbi:mannitol dehydrogenase family protein [Curvibacter sp. CHRR-16]|uniref:mannitol dehydrogenase family protein n=1 Tax=Curvibacter sp. CHRR-16 TaxID=2835872 RepID=UPI001BDA0B06|nr:mannitol dehydrogenase family protein [Curvibacter sp. CHRR-16]MBT0570027.1 mannitol dehydrogenase family protein [Curvibacter sp. CHRR-16]